MSQYLKKEDRYLGWKCHGKMGWTQFERRIFFNIFATIFEDIPGWFLVPGIYNYSRTITVSNGSASKCLLTYLSVNNCVQFREKLWDIWLLLGKTFFKKRKEKLYIYFGYPISDFTDL